MSTPVGASAGEGCAVDEPAFTALDYEVVTNSLMLIGGSLSRYVLDQATLEPVTPSIPPGAGFGLAVTGNVAYTVSLLGKEVLEIDPDGAVARPVANASQATPAGNGCYSFPGTGRSDGLSLARR